MPINNYYIVALTEAAKVLVKEIRSNLRGGNYPDEIIKGLQVGTAKATERGAEIRIVFTAPMSAAFERGSGEHGPDREKYRIEPKNVGALAFEWDKTPAGPGEKFIGGCPGPLPPTHSEQPDSLLPASPLRMGRSWTESLGLPSGLRR